MIWRFRKFLKSEAVLFAGLFTLVSILPVLAESETNAGKSQEDLPLDAFQTRTLPLAKKYLAENQLDKARNLLETLLELEPKNVEAHLVLGEICFKEKKFERATRLLASAMNLSHSPEEALKANALLKVMPPRFTKPKLPTLNRANANNVETAQDEREQFHSEDNAVKVFYFTAAWLSEDNALKEDLKNSLSKSGAPTELETIELGQAKQAGLFTEYSISLLPAVVVLKSDGHFVGGAAGNQIDRDLRNLLKQAR